MVAHRLQTPVFRLHCPDAQLTTGQLQVLLVKMKPEGQAQELLDWMKGEAQVQLVWPLELLVLTVRFPAQVVQTLAVWQEIQLVMLHSTHCDVLLLSVKLAKQAVHPLLLQVEQLAVQFMQTVELPPVEYDELPQLWQVLLAVRMKLFMHDRQVVPLQF